MAGITHPHVTWHASILRVALLFNVAPPVCGLGDQATVQLLIRYEVVFEKAGDICVEKVFAIGEPDEGRARRDAAVWLPRAIFKHDARVELYLVFVPVIDAITQHVPHLFATVIAVIGDRWYPVIRHLILSNK
jgi:hypothetical protein